MLTELILYIDPTVEFESVDNFFRDQNIFVLQDITLDLNNNLEVIVSESVELSIEKSLNNYELFYLKLLPTMEDAGLPHHPVPPAALLVNFWIFNIDVSNIPIFFIYILTIFSGFIFFFISVFWPVNSKNNSVCSSESIGEFIVMKDLKIIEILNEYRVSGIMCDSISIIAITIFIIVLFINIKILFQYHDENIFLKLKNYIILWIIS